MIINQIKVGHMKVFSYLVGCEKTRKAVVIDPGGNIKEIIKKAKDNDLKIEYIFNTHYHADHTCGNRKLKKLTNAKILIHKLEVKQLLKVISFIKVFTFNLELSPKPDIFIEKEQEFKVGDITFKIIHTPGHTLGGLCFLAGKNLFTGDTLFVGDSGRTDLPGGNRSVLGASLRKIMFSLPGNTIVWPGHDYGVTKISTLDWERRNNINAKEYGYYLED